MIKEAKLFLLDLNASSDSARILKDILDAPSNIDIKLYTEGIAACNTTSENINNISLFDTDILFVVLSVIRIEYVDELIDSIKNRLPKLPIIVVMEGSDPDQMVQLLKKGVADFLIPPLKSIDVLPRIWRLLEQKSSEKVLLHTLREKIGLKQIVGESAAFTKEIEKIPMVAKCDVAVLISGETGTGKELCARAIHYLSPRAGNPFIPVNCGAMPMELVENELFGHVKGAFTGASQPYSGLIQEADGGTLFLDEIGSLPLQVQVKLLRFLQDKEYRQLGSAKLQQADVRIIAASNLDLEKAMSEGKFRQDLFYRLNIIPLMLPPLRERKRDIPVLAHHFLSKCVSELNKDVSDFTPEALRKLAAYDWPGNIRELENVIERGVVFSKQAVIESDDVVLPQSQPVEPESLKVAKAKMIAQFERDFVQEFLQANHGNISKAARAAKKNPRSFRALIRKYRIDMQNFKPVSR